MILRYCFNNPLNSILNIRLFGLQKASALRKQFEKHIRLEERLCVVFSSGNPWYRVRPLESTYLRHVAFLGPGDDAVDDLFMANLITFLMDGELDTSDVGFGVLLAKIRIQKSTRHTLAAPPS